MVGSLLIALWASPAFGQLIDFKALLEESSSVDARRIGNLEVAEVYLDGRSLFSIGAPVVNVAEETGSIEWRIEEVHFKLNRLLTAGFDPNTLETTVATMNKQTVILVDHGAIEPRSLLTVTDLDAAIDRETDTVKAAAERRASILKSALLRAHHERQPDYIYPQLRNSFFILLMTVGVLWGLKRLQTYRHNRYKCLEAELAPDIAVAQPPPGLNPEPLSGEAYSQTQAYVLRRLSRYKMTNRTVRFILAVLQTMVLFGGTALILGRFAQTKSTANWLLTFPWSLVLIVIGVMAIKGIFDWIMVLGFNRWLTMVEEGDGLRDRTKLRIQTILPILQETTFFIAWVLGALIFFEMINALPIALVLLAIFAFGFQTLFKDWLRGFLILSEDHYAQGDVIKIGAIAGTVEYMSLRVTQLRTLDGELVSIDHGSFAQIINFTREWSQLNLGIEVDFQTDIDQAISVVKTVAEEIYYDPAWASFMIEKPSVLGCDSFNANKVTIRLLIKTRPWKKWDIGREYRRRLKVAFDKAGIIVPIHHHIVQFESTIPHEIQ